MKEGLQYFGHEATVMRNPNFILLVALSYSNLGNRSMSIHKCGNAVLSYDGICLGLASSLEPLEARANNAQGRPIGCARYLSFSITTFLIWVGAAG